MIYFDNAATTYPKPSSVLASAVLAMKKYSTAAEEGIRRVLKPVK